MNILKFIFGEITSRIGVVITIVPAFFILMWYDERKFQNRADIISKKGNQITDKERLNGKIIFIVYISVTLALYYFVPSFVASYSQK